MRAKMLSVMAGGLIMAAAPMLAHHSFSAEYDRSKPVTLKGTVTKVEWMNPHARFYLDVKDDAGKVTNWTRNSLKEGDVVTVNGSQAKDGTNLVNANNVAFENGKRVLGGASSSENAATQ
jgi:hypothetical protein